MGVPEGCLVVSEPFLRLNKLDCFWVELESSSTCTRLPTGGENLRFDLDDVRQNFSQKVSHKKPRSLFFTCEEMNGACGAILSYSMILAPSSLELPLERLEKFCKFLPLRT